MQEIYDPIEFIGKIEILTITIIGSFVTWKFLNAIYEYIYEPTVDAMINSETTDKYYVKIGKNYVQIGMIFKEFIKWTILIVSLMIFYNIFVKK